MSEDEPDEKEPGWVHFSNQHGQLNKYVGQAGTCAKCGMWRCQHASITALRALQLLNEKPGGSP